MKYRKKPVVIEAMQYVSGKDIEPILSWAGSSIYHTSDLFKIETMEGIMIAQRGDWIIKGIKGEFYPCKPDIFEATYEAVE